MFWGVLLVCLAAAGYMLHLLKEYKLFVEAARPRIENLKTHSENLDKAVEAEREKTRAAIDRVRVIKDQEMDVRNEIALIDGQIRQAQDLENNLEMDMYKAEFKRSKKRVQS